MLTFVIEKTIKATVVRMLCWCLFLSQQNYPHPGSCSEL